MAVRTQCPRCKQPLSVPNKLAGSYASCPRCQGRFWVSKDAPVDPALNDAVAAPAVGTLTLTEAPVATPPIVSPPIAAPPAAPPTPAPRQYFPSVTPLAPAPAAPAAPPIPLPTVDGVPTAPPAAPPQTRKVARLVTADTAQSTFKLAADGQLPHLQLQEGDGKDKGQGKSRSIPPLVMILAWVLSVAVTVAIVLVSNNNDDMGVTTEAKQEALLAIEKNFFGHPERGELLPYERLLREARQARVRRDSKAERQYYKKVLDLLHTETWGGSSGSRPGRGLEKGITGSRDRDRELEQYILTVLKD